ncbi:uncharacterized protein EAE98_010609 [Botrytis deweyae]|uniref:DUF7587 domain-containing protein n=1 Tax=Botrytis deweyae TaxID=2478750 RepID=A0ABQ7I8U5_9HELO|nr:uncharacterized protein EAE98_010609 [Botrytis deweyae]KAF7916600.1 hypothetical protein EAE98_010609 [Botrytis deweyae]
MSSQLFYRVYSPTSAGGLVSGKANQGWHRPSHINLEREFENHKKLSNRKPTALVSVTSSIIRALKTAFDKHYKDGEDLSDIWIAFIQVPDRELDVCHSAKEMANRFRARNPALFKDEYLFEWEIPMKYVVHRISAQTLFDRGLNMKEYCEKIGDEDSDSSMIILPSTSDLRTNIANALCNFTIDRNGHVYNSHEMFECHVRLASMVRAFGARALGLNIAWEIFADCCKGRFSSARHFNQRYDAIKEGCHEVLLDFWLLDSQFNYEYECHLEYAFHLQETMTARWDEFLRNGIDIYDDHTRYEEELEMLMKIEADAVSIGL